MRGRLWFLWNKLTREFGFLNLSWQRSARLFLMVVMVGGMIIGFGTPQVAHAVDRPAFIKDSCAVLKGHLNFPTADLQCVTDASKCSSIKDDSEFTKCVNTEVQSVKTILDSHPPSESCADASFFSGNNFKCTILDIIQFILGWIIKGLGKVLTFLIEIFLGFAQYNGFADAPPVLMGWKLVRDLVNMFFIVILLVSAFATIIGYGGEDFHAAHVLPKLLLMAVLINFSKTLIQLLIDFSQVIMLTFVNAFQTGASAQLVDAFGLTTVTKEAGGGGVADLMNVIISYLLGIVVLIISIGVMVILIGYIIGRIVGLWMALIFSPLALFATAIPSKLQKGMGSLTTKYWGDLTGMLTGGPIIAFYLWLTIAILQSASAGGEQLSKSLKLYNPVAAVDQNGFFTQLGQSGSIAKFIIAITLLMMAMKQAVESAGAVSSSMGEFAQKVQGYTRSAAGTALAPIRFAAASPFLAARTGLRGVKAGAAAAERRWDFRGKVGRLGQATVGRMPGLRGVLRAPLAGATTAGKAQREKEVADLLKPTAGMSHAQKLQFASSLPTGRTASPAERQAHASIMQDLASDKSQLGETKRLAAQYESAGGMSKDEATSRARAEVAATSAGHLATAKRMYQDLAAKDPSVMDKVKEIDDQIEKNPFLEQDDAKRAALLNKIRLDPEKIKAVSADAASRGNVLMGLLPQSAIQATRDADGKIVGPVTGFDRAQADAFMAQHKDTPIGKNMAAMMKLVGDTTGGVALGNLEGLLFQKGAKGESLSFNADGTRAFSGKENLANISVEREITGHATQGRNAPNDLTAGAEAAFTEGLNAGIPFTDLVQKAGTIVENRVDPVTGAVTQAETRDTALDSRLSGHMFAAMNGAVGLPAGDKANLDIALREVVQIAPQLEDQGVDSQLQLHIIEGIESGGGAQVIEEKWKDADYNQRKAFEKIAKVAVARANDVAKKRASAAATGATFTPTAQEAATERLVADLKTRMPEYRIKPGGGAPEIPQAPHGMHEILYKTRDTT